MIEWWLVDEIWLWFKNNIIFAMIFFLILFTTSAMTNDDQTFDQAIKQLRLKINCMSENQNQIIKHHQCVHSKPGIQTNKPECPLPVFKKCFEQDKL